MSKFENLIFLLGASRSGTTWIGKIFDSNPDVLYRHEPDVRLGGGNIPRICNEPEKYKAEAIHYIEQLCDVNDARTNSKPPIFSKNYHNIFQEELRKLCIYSLRYGGVVMPKMNGWPVPDFIGEADHKTVIKSVGALGRAGLFSAAAPASRIIQIIRHPCAHVGSVLRGQQLNKLAREIPLGFADADVTAHYDLSLARLKSMSLLEQACWRWVILNHKAMQDLEGRANAMTLVYEDLCAAPFEVARKLFEFAGIGWEAQTEAFLAESTQPNGSSEYHNLFRTPLDAANSWRKELTGDEISLITRIVRDTPPGRLFSYD